MRTLLLLGATVLLARSGWGEVAVYGRVLDERGSPVAGARLTVTSALEAQVLAVASTDSTGSFKLKLESAGSYLLDAAKEGFFEIKQYRFSAAEPNVELLLTMNVLREVFQTLDVNGTPSPLDLDQSGTKNGLAARTSTIFRFQPQTICATHCVSCPARFRTRPDAFTFRAGQTGKRTI